MAGRGLADNHVQSDHSEVALPTVAFDYGYLGDREERNAAPSSVALRHPNAVYR